MNVVEFQRGFMKLDFKTVGYWVSDDFENFLVENKHLSE